jgi:hypothetical protein
MTPRRKLRILVAEHKHRHLETLVTSLSDSLASLGDVIAECEACSSVGVALKRLRVRQYDAVVTDWRWPPEVDPEGPEDHDLGQKIAARAKQEGVKSVAVVTRERDLFDAASADLNVDRAFLWEDLHGGSDTLASYLLEALFPMAFVPQADGIDPRRVFVVFGHDPDALAAMTRFLEDLDLRVMDFGDARTRTANHMRSLGETRPITTYDIVDYATARAAAVLCLLTPDEIVRPANGGKRTSEVRPRPNVIFEAGLAFARQPAKTLLVKVGATTSWSDVDGVQYAAFSNVPERRDELVDWLESFQLPVDRRKSEWRTKDYGLSDYAS